MTKVFKIFCSTLYLIFISLLTFGQTDKNLNTNELILGKWVCCYAIDTLDTLFKCESQNVIYTFNADNTFIELHNYPNQNENIKSIRQGKWIITETEFTLDPDDIGNAIYYPATRPIKWINNDFFYFLGLEGKNGPFVYTCFQRIK